MTQSNPNMTPKDALNIAINGSDAYRQKVASAAPNTPLQPDTALNVHAIMQNELVKTANAIREETPDAPIIETLNKIAEYIGKGYPANVAASYVVGNDRALCDKLAGFFTDTGNALLQKFVVADYQNRLKAYKEQKAAAVVAAKYPHIINAADKLNTLIQMKQNSQ
jgi:hypothetical protein